MPYCTQQDFTTRFGADELLQLTDRDGDGVGDDGVFDAAAADAGDEIDSYLMANGRYALPLATVPPVLTRVALDIARYRLYAARASEEVTNRYNQAVAWLTQLSRGTVSLGIDPPPSASSTSSDDALYCGGKQVFSQDRLAPYLYGEGQS